jgi:hypothetical protein
MISTSVVMQSGWMADLVLCVECASTSLVRTLHLFDLVACDVFPCPYAVNAPYFCMRPCRALPQHCAVRVDQVSEHVSDSVPSATIAFVLYGERMLCPIIRSFHGKFISFSRSAGQMCPTALCCAAPTECSPAHKQSVPIQDLRDTVLAPRYDVPISAVSCNFKCMPLNLPP